MPRGHLLETNTFLRLKKNLQTFPLLEVVLMHDKWLQCIAMAQDMYQTNMKYVPHICSNNSLLYFWPSVNLHKKIKQLHKLTKTEDKLRNFSCCAIFIVALLSYSWHYVVEFPYHAY